jgi:hypothetical protein
MSALLMDSDRAKFASGDPFGGSIEEIKAAYESFWAYCGTYKVDSEKGTVTHHVEGSSFPNWVGTSQVRSLKLSGDKLFLSATLEIKGELWNLKGTLRRLHAPKT